MKTLVPFALLLLFGAACERYVPRVVCHNSNCKEPTDPSQDDTVEALEESLALADEDGRPPFDGVELDFFWRGEDDQCIYAHDLERNDNPLLPEDGIRVLNEHLLARARAGLPTTHDGGPFIVFLELKHHVGVSKSDRHSPEQLAAHAACGLDAVDSLIAGAELSRVPLDITITSFEPDLLTAVRADPRWDERPSPQVTLGLGGLQAIPPPLAADSQPIGVYGDVPLTSVSAHPHWLRRGELQALRDRGIEIGYWMFQAVPETFAAIERDEPDFVTTSEANLLRRWLER